MNWRSMHPVVLCFAGIGGVFYEMVFVHPADLGLLTIFAAMMGLPIFLSSKNGRNGGEDK